MPQTSSVPGVEIWSNRPVFRKSTRMMYCERLPPWRHRGRHATTRYAFRTGPGSGKTAQRVPLLAHVIDTVFRCWPCFVLDAGCCCVWITPRMDAFRFSTSYYYPVVGIMVENDLQTRPSALRCVWASSSPKTRAERAWMHKARGGLSSAVLTPDLFRL